MYHRRLTPVVTSRLAGVGLGALCVWVACIPFVGKRWADVDRFCTVYNGKVAHVPYNGVAQPIRPREGAGLRDRAACDGRGGRGGRDRQYYRGPGYGCQVSTRSEGQVSCFVVGRGSCSTP